MLTSMLAVMAGGAIGCVARWLLGNAFNLLYPAIPPGTLAANLIGGYLIGVSIAVFAAHPWLPPQWRLFVITGFLGGLTTFSSFSGEVVLLLKQEQFATACLAMLLHLGGSLLMTFAGMASFTLLKARY
jgi:CrcB protein